MKIACLPDRQGAWNLYDMIIAIDGPGGAGKSTVAKRTAQKLGFLYIDTGAMYRALTLKIISSKADIKDVPKLTQIARKMRIKFKKSKDGSLRIFSDGKEVSRLIREKRVTELVSDIAKIKEVREVMVKLQRGFGSKASCVLDGRDIGTVVFPQAQVKIFMYADLDVRAQRRVRECAEKKIPATLDDVLENLKFRDKYDSGREHSPLKKARDAIEVDTTLLTIEEEIALVKKIVLEKTSST